MCRHRLLQVALLIALLPAVAQPAWSHPPRLSDHQIHLLAYAWHVGEEYDLSLTMAGILMQESLAGILSPVGDRRFALGARAYGVMQIRLPAARDALRLCPQLGRYTVGEEIIARLITDDYWNIEVAGCYLAHLQSRSNGNWRKILAAYNRGFRGAQEIDLDSNAYATSVVEWVTDGVVGRYQDEIALVARYLFGPPRLENTLYAGIHTKNLASLRPLSWSPALPPPLLAPRQATAHCPLPDRNGLSNPALPTPVASAYLH